MCGDETSVVSDLHKLERETRMTKVDSQEYVIADIDTIVKASSGGDFLFLSKAGDKLSLCILWDKENDGRASKSKPLPWIHTFSSFYDGKPVPQVIFKAVKNSAEGQEPVIVVGKPSHQRGILVAFQQLMEDGNIPLDPNEASVLTFSKAGSGLNTRYTVMPSTRKVDIKAHLGAFDQSLAEYAATLSRKSQASQGAPTQTFDVSDDELEF